MKHTMLLHDGTKYPFDDSFLDFVKERMKDGAPFPFKDDTIRGSDIKRIITGSDMGQYGPHISQEELPALAAAVFGDTQYDQLFWKQALVVNRERQENDLPWVFKACINWAAAECGHKDVSELFAFIEAEWETAKLFNVPGFPNDNQDVRGQREFFTSEQGKEYALKWRAYDVMWKRERRLTNVQ